MAFLRSVWGPFLVAPVLRRMVEQAGSRVFWAVQGVLVGGLVLLAGITLQREVAVLKLHTEVGELKGLLAAFSGRETTAGEEVFLSKTTKPNFPSKPNHSSLTHPTTAV